ncbi:DUF4179 domain-containing protein [Bacillus sp. T33-2]|uniref:DUF4179 domain-containing protein n=1 Tax=Bacillus sp. T33-2 TaxID=2054168 RepID=UPI000C77DF11|nr:DUF4179 domain-containing protein [Bacillus sp. T33-2]PLR98410.1 hypothetical protein CVD19_04820 [Bacillus sp. T33-2]
MKVNEARFKEVIDTIEVPDSIREFTNNIPQLYKEGNLSAGNDSGKVKPISRTKRKWFLPGAAAIAAACILGSGFISPTVANVLQRVPFLEMVYDEGISPFYGFSDASHENMTTKINETVQDNGVRMTLNEAVYDGIRLGLSYTIEVDKDLESIGTRLVGKDLGVSFTFNEKKPENWGYNWESRKVGPNTFVAVQSIPYVKQFGEKDLNVSIHFTSLGEENNEGKIIKGDWVFKHIPIKKLDTKLIEPNKIVTTENITLQIAKIQISPLTTQITFDQSRSKAKKYSIVVKDDKGNQLEMKNTTRSANPLETPVYETEFKTIDHDTTFLDVKVINDKNKDETAEIRIPVK